MLALLPYFHTWSLVNLSFSGYVFPLGFIKMILRCTHYLPSFIPFLFQVKLWLSN